MASTKNINFSNLSNLPNLPNKKSQTVNFINTRRRHHTYQFSPFSFQF